MRFKFLATIAALALVAACETAPETSGSASGSGGASAAAPGSAGGGAAASSVPAPGSAEEFNTDIGDRVYFDFDQFVLKDDARNTLRKQATWLKWYPRVNVTVEGHADERGTREYNLGLGERRANAVKDYLVALGISPDRIKTISYGKERPVCAISAESCWSLNRRGVTQVAVPGT